jgi:hypothetical protein
MEGSLVFHNGDSDGKNMKYSFFKNGNVVAILNISCSKEHPTNDFNVNLSTFYWNDKTAQFAASSSDYFFNVYRSNKIKYFSCSERRAITRKFATMREEFGSKLIGPNSAQN